eukprot:TRINITY_DN6643_c0_g2_i1.p1 TRINITY_DN6643_c0_g2~~TRINITY_DN6643_c0_g2_i1.p1  ORF type:complete len:150 (-),score=49.95 TRINITY_DN6643_c0_g2_i1:206-655(-)
MLRRCVTSHALFARDVNHDGKISPWEAVNYANNAAQWAEGAHPRQKDVDNKADLFKFVQKQVKHEEEFEPDLKLEEAPLKCTRPLKMFDLDENGVLDPEEYERVVHSEHVQRWESRNNQEQHSKLLFGHHESLRDFNSALKASSIQQEL